MGEIIGRSRGKKENYDTENMAGGTELNPQEGRS